MATPGTVDQYLAALPDDRRAVLEGLRATIRSAAPDATETIAYQMPAFRMGKRFLVSYAAFQRHTSLFPASAVVVETIGASLGPYLHGRGTIRFPVSEPIPSDLVRRIVAIRLAEVAAVDVG